jgi:hypothetical protein
MHSDSTGIETIEKARGTRRGLLGRIQEIKEGKILIHSKKEGKS